MWGGEEQLEGEVWSYACYAHREYYEVYGINYVHRVSD